MRRAALTLPVGRHDIRPGKPVSWLVMANREGFTLCKDFVESRAIHGPITTLAPVTFATRDFPTLSAATEFALAFQHSDLELVWTEVADV